jgi:hypothetical protein
MGFRGLKTASVALVKLLKHPDASVRQRAVELIVEHTQILEKLAARPLDHPAGSRTTSSSGDLVVPPGG